MKTGIVDYKAGNLKSIENVLEYLKADFIISDKPELLMNCDKLIFPGVGEAGSAMAELKRAGLDHMMREFFKSGKLILGICLGCQIILDRSEEGNVDCLGLVPGEVRKFPSGKLKVPEIGWNNIKKVADSYILKGIPDDSAVYFVHSYYPYVEERYAAASTCYIVPFYSILDHENITAVQFHPERSGKTGIKMIENFLEYRG